MDNMKRSPRDGTGCLYIPFAFPGVPAVGCAFSTACAGSVSMNVGSGSVWRDTSSGLLCPPGQDHKSPAPSAKAAPSLSDSKLSRYLDEDTRQAPANRRRLLDALGLSRWAELKQVHGDGFVVDARETPPDQAAELEADGHCTREKGLALLIKTADCQPILFAAEDGSVVAALHAGWRGNAVNYPASGLKAFCAAYGLEPSRVLAVRGPSLGPAAAEFVNFAAEWPPHFVDWFDARQKTMDLWRLTRDQLVSAGMRADRIFGLDLCTRSLPELFFSHRLGHSGRQASLIWIKEKA